MIIYCAGAIKGDNTYQDNYKEIIKTVETLGHTALSELNTKFNPPIPLNDKQIYQRDMKWIDGSKLMIAEVSGPSLGVGFEIAYAVFVKKIPVLAVYAENAPAVSSMLTGCGVANFVIKKYYNFDDLQRNIRNFILNSGVS